MKTKTQPEAASRPATSILRGLKTLSDAYTRIWTPLTTLLNDFNESGDVALSEFQVQLMCVASLLFCGIFVDSPLSFPLTILGILLLILSVTSQIVLKNESDEK